MCAHIFRLVFCQGQKQTCAGCRQDHRPKPQAGPGIKVGTSDDGGEDPGPTYRMTGGVQQKGTRTEICIFIGQYLPALPTQLTDEQPLQGGNDAIPLRESQGMQRPAVDYCCS